MSFKFGDVQLLDIMNFLGGATSLDSFLKAYKTAETKGYFPYERFDCPQKMNNSELPPYDAIFSKLRNMNPLEKNYSDYQKLLGSGLKTEEALSKMKLPNHHLQERKTTNICLIYGIMRICAHLKTFYAGTTTKTLSQHSKQCKKCWLFITRKELTCLHKSTSAKFNPFTETDKDLLQKIREDMVGGPSIVFTRKAVVDETFIRKSENICKSIVGIDASQLYPYSMCQPMPTGL